MTSPTSQNRIVGLVLAKYNLSATRILPHQSGYRNRSYPVRLTNAQTVNLILYKSEPGILPRIRHANYVSNYLAIQGLPVRHTLGPQIIRLQSPTRVKYGAVYNYLPGHTIEWSMYSMKHIKLLGMTMSRLHAALRGLKRPDTLPSVTDEYHPIIKRMRIYFAHPAVQMAMRSKLGLTINQAQFQIFEKLLQHCAKLPGQQILHMDFVRSNILFGEHSETLQIGTAAITGILDFEKVAYGHPVFDIARTLAFLLVDVKTKPEAKIRKYFLRSGYLKRGHGALEEPKFLEPLIDLFLTYDFYKFLRHNPYDYLYINEHYVRTVKLLKQRGLITSTITPTISETALL